MMLSLKNFLFILFCVSCFGHRYDQRASSHHYEGAQSLLAAATNYTLRNTYFSVIFSCYGSAVSMTSLQMNQSYGLFGSDFHEFLYTDTSILALRSASGIFLSNETWLQPQIVNSTKILSSASSLHFLNLQIGVPAIAYENWNIVLKGNELSWSINRTYSQSVDLIADRLPAIAFDSYAGGIPSFLDPGLIFNGTSGFVIFDLYAHLGELLSENRDQTLQISPQGLRLDMRFDSGFFSFAKMPVDGTGPVTIFGAETIDRRNSTVLARYHGSVQSQQMRLQLKGAAKPPAGLNLSLSDSNMNELAQKIATIHNMWMGFIFGNNPCSATCLHEIGWFGMIQGMFVANSPTLAALTQQLTFMLNTSVTMPPSKHAGYVQPRFNILGYYEAIWGPLHDQIPHMILSVYYTVLASGDANWLKSVMPTVDLVMKYMLSCDSDNSSLLSVPGASGLSDGKRHTSNWYDIIEFGNKDAYINIYCVMALEAMSEMKLFLNDSESAAEYKQLYKQWASAYNQYFWQPNEGIYADWIDTNNQIHSYFYTDQNLLAIITGVANADQAQQIIASLDESYANLLGAFQVNQTALYATPANMWPITVNGDMVYNGTLGDQMDFPHYENGLSFFHSTGFEVAARAMAGDPDEAYEVFERVMLFGFERNQFWGAASDWINGTLSSEPLNNSLLTLWGLLRGCFGVWPSLQEIRVVGRPSSQLEGATYSFAYLGKTVSLRVQNGQVIVSK